MPSEEVIAITTYGELQKTAGGEVRLFRWSSQERLIRGLKALGLCWGLAVFSVFIPVLHFVLVPAFFLVGIVTFFIFYKQESGIIDGKAVCPNCNASFEIVGGKDRWPFFDICNSCKANVRVERS